MIRNKINNTQQPSAILTSDWHLRETHPICRTDNFWETQWRKVDFISDLQKQYNCPVYHAGDLFDYWKPSPMLLSETIKHLPRYFMSVYGNHDLPQHNIELKNKSGLYCLEQARKLLTDSIEIEIETIHWNHSPEERKEANILIWHVSTYQGKEPYPGCMDQKAATLLRKYPQYDLIVTGDNHKPFVEEFEGRVLVNPGSIFRMDADQIDHRPRVYLWYSETNTVKPVYLPIENDVISREHIEIKEKRDARIEAFVSQLNNDWLADLSFEDNLKRFELSNKIPKEIMSIIYKSIEV